MEETKKYYWLKLKRDFFKRHDIKIIEAMENGEKYVLFYLKLLVESLDHNGNLRFSDTVPYNEKMLSAITCTDIDTVRIAMRMFLSLGMMNLMDDSTYYMAQVVSMTGDETKFAAQKRQYRLGQLSDNDRTMSDKSIELRVKSIELRDNKDKQSKQFIKPTLQDCQNYSKERSMIIDASAFWHYYDAGDWKDGTGKKIANWKQKMLTWENKEREKHPTLKPIIKPEKICPKCGGKIKGSACMSCYTNFDSDGKEI